MRSSHGRVESCQTIELQTLSVTGVADLWLDPRPLTVVELRAALLTPRGCVLAHGIDLASVAATPRTSLRRGAGRVARRAGHPTLWCSV
jgi:hypothetical protein